MNFANMANKCTEIRELVVSKTKEKNECITRAQMDASAAEERITAADEEMQRAVEASDMTRYEQAARQKDFYTAQRDLARQKLAGYAKDNIVPVNEYLAVRADAVNTARQEYNALCAEVLRLVSQANQLVADYSAEFSKLAAYTESVYELTNKQVSTQDGSIKVFDLPNQHAMNQVNGSKIAALESYVNTLKNA